MQPPKSKQTHFELKGIDQGLIQTIINEVQLQFVRNILYSHSVHLFASYRDTSVTWEDIG